MDDNERVLIDSGSWFRISKSKKGDKTIVTIQYCTLLVGANGKEIGIHKAPKVLTLELEKAQELAAKILFIEDL